MMFLLLALTAVVNADPLSDALKSSDKLLKLFVDFEAEQGNVLSASEAKLRFRIFRKNVQEIVDINDRVRNHGSTAPYLILTGGWM